MKNLMMFLLFILSLGARAQHVADSISVAEMHEDKQVWGKTLNFDKKITYLGTDNSIALFTIPQK